MEQQQQQQPGSGTDLGLFMSNRPDTSEAGERLVGVDRPVHVGKLNLGCFVRRQLASQTELPSHGQVSCYPSS